MMQPEYGVKCRPAQIVHMASVPTGIYVDGVMNYLDAESASTIGITGKIVVRHRSVCQ